MSLEQNLHKAMVKMVLGSVVKLDEEEKVKVSLKNPSSKPESRGVKGFFLSGLKEIQKEMKKSDKKSPKHTC